VSALLDETWQLKAACRGPQSVVFFPPPRFERKDEKLEREARARGICDQCSVNIDCLDYALAIREPHGIWGGSNEAERRSMLAASEAQQAS
jgi:WhiB family redox-sensing transcriptional regulator